MDILSIIRLLRRRISIVGPLAVLAVVCLVGIYQTSPPTYRVSSSFVLLSPAQKDPTGTTTTTTSPEDHVDDDAERPLGSRHRSEIEERRGERPLGTRTSASATCRSWSTSSPASCGAHLPGRACGPRERSAPGRSEPTSRSTTARSLTSSSRRPPRLAAIHTAGLVVKEARHDLDGLQTVRALDPEDFIRTATIVAPDRATTVLSGTLRRLIAAVGAEVLALLGIAVLADVWANRRAERRDRRGGVDERRTASRRNGAWTRRRSSAEDRRARETRLGGTRRGPAGLHGQSAWDDPTAARRAIAPAGGTSRAGRRLESVDRATAPMTSTLTREARPVAPQRALRAVTLLRVEVWLLALIPGRLVVGALGGLGSPALLLGLGLFLWWLISALSPGLGVVRCCTPLRVVVGLLWLAMLVSYAADEHPRRADRRGDERLAVPDHDACVQRRGSHRGGGPARSRRGPPGGPVARRRRCGDGLHRHHPVQARDRSHRLPRQDPAPLGPRRPDVARRTRQLHSAVEHGVASHRVRRDRGVDARLRSARPPV